MRKLNYIGMKINGVVILGEGSRFKTNFGTRFKLRCSCPCGEEFEALFSSLKDGLNSCGCKTSEKHRKGVTKHGMRYTRTYRIWLSMKNRCTNPNNSWYFHYGAKGVRLCDNWLEFPGFFADMGVAPDGKSIDRLNDSKIYSKETCRWATPKEQVYNSSSVKILTHNGVSDSIIGWAKRMGIDRNTISRRLAKGLPIEQVLRAKK